MSLQDIIKTTALLSTLVSLTACTSKRIIPANHSLMSEYNCPTSEQLELRDNDLEESTYVNTLYYITENGDNISELALELTKFAKMKYSQEIIPITQQEIIDAAGITNPKKLPSGIEIIIPVYRPPTPLDLLHSRLVGEFGDKKEFEYIISH